MREPRAKVRKCTGQMKKWAEQYAQSGDAMEALFYAYPRAEQWKSSGKRALINKLLRHPLVMQLVSDIRAPVAHEMAMNFRWRLREATRQYYACSVAGDRANAHKFLKLLADMTGGDLRPPLPPNPQSEIEDGELLDITQQVFGGRLPAIEAANGRGAAIGSEAIPGVFRELLRGAPTGAAPQDTLHRVTDDDSGAFETGDGVRPAGGREIDLFERLRASLGTWEGAGDRPDSGEPHSGTE